MQHADRFNSGKKSMLERNIDLMQADVNTAGLEYEGAKLHKRDDENYLQHGHDPLYRLYHQHILPEKHGEQ